MIDPLLFKTEEGVTTIEKNLRNRFYNLELLEQTKLIVAHRFELNQKIENAQAQRNLLSKEIGRYVAEKESTAKIESAKEQVKNISDSLKIFKEEMDELENRSQELLLSLPNILADDVPQGKDESENVVIRSWGEKPQFSFSVLPHYEFAEKNNLIDFTRGVKLSGSRFYVYNQEISRLERKLIDMMISLHIETGYQERTLPFIVSNECMVGTGQFPKFKDEYYTLERDGMSLIPTAEVPLTNLYRDEILSSAQLPLYLCAQSSCFRREAGSAGKDTRGLIRVHQFQKVELVKFVHPDSSPQELESLTRSAEAVLQKLELHYRVILLCSGDTSFSSCKTYDLEVWLPGMQRWLEISSCSNFNDFQARRAAIRFKDKDSGKNRLVHTLNGSGVAAGRLIAALLEYYQTEDGGLDWQKIYSLMDA